MFADLTNLTLVRCMFLVTLPFSLFVCFKVTLLKRFQGERCSIISRFQGSRFKVSRWHCSKGFSERELCNYLSCPAQVEQEYEKVFKFQEYEKLSTRGEVQLFQFRLCKSMIKSMIKRFQRERPVQLFELASGQWPGCASVWTCSDSSESLKMWKCECVKVKVWKWKYESESVKRDAMSMSVQS